jgi:hypothetical protein
VDPFNLSGSAFTDVIQVKIGEAAWVLAWGSEDLFCSSSLA